ncbi:MAG TPA: hypothetical protein VFJ62_07820, partial [Usitatibacter sp.]|nr:hypothetical protein [Usitatibacter sp.]
MKTVLLMQAACSVFLAACATAPAWDGKPTNDLPHPYRTIAPWGKLPASHPEWGALSAVAVDRDGRSLWVADRCGKNPDVPPGENPFLFDSCAGSTWAPVHLLDADGNIVRSFGAGLFVFPHKIYQDRDGNVWVVDLRARNERERRKFPDAPPAGHTVVKFAPDGRVLMTIGKPGIAGDPQDGLLNQPCSIVEAPNGDILISEGHSGNPKSPPGTVARISRFTRDGKFIRSFGKLGSGPGELMTP